jgi:hypothetical protein
MFIGYFNCTASPNQSRGTVRSSFQPAKFLSLHLFPRYLWLPSLIALALFSVYIRGIAADPRINYITTFGTNQVLIHFDTEANSTYILQYSTNVLSTNWSNIYTGYNYPFSSHYVVPDTRTNKSRFYRLRVTTS